jgi:hypothetical protein
MKKLFLFLFFIPSLSFAQSQAVSANPSTGALLSPLNFFSGNQPTFAGVNISPTQSLKFLNSGGHPNNAYMVGINQGTSNPMAMQFACELVASDLGIGIDPSGFGASHVDPLSRYVFSDCPGDITNRFQLCVGGTMHWGPGSAALDTHLNREAVGELLETGRFDVTNGYALNGKLFALNTSSVNLLYADTGGEGSKDSTGANTIWSCDNSGNFTILLSLNTPSYSVGSKLLAMNQGGYNVFFSDSSGIATKDHTGANTNLTLPDAGGLTANRGSITTATGSLIETSSQTPASSGAAGVTGTISWDANFIYVCVAANTWKRTAISTW